MERMYLYNGDRLMEVHFDKLALFSKKSMGFRNFQLLLCKRLHNLQPEA
jgi:hypothetical protein